MQQDAKEVFLQNETVNIVGVLKKSNFATSFLQQFLQF